MAAANQEDNSPTRAALSLDEYYQGIRAGDTSILARALTLVESKHADHEQLAEQLLTRLMPHTGGAIRVGITGHPGAGKSTLIEALGMFLIDAGHHVAVLAIDPSSQISGGSILGDKTRMPRLAAEANAYIRPSPSSGNLGGAARRTRECLLICEAAGYDIVLVETVGVGQSESFVASMTDALLAIMLPLAGDELQGIKKGLLEHVDVIAVNKADGDLVDVCQATANQYRSALASLSTHTEELAPQVFTCSALHQQQIDTLWEEITRRQGFRQNNGMLAARRQQQNLHWLWAIVESRLKQLVQHHPQVEAIRSELEQQVVAGQVSAESAARRILEACAMM